MEVNLSLRTSSLNEQLVEWFNRRCRGRRSRRSNFQHGDVTELPAFCHFCNHHFLLHSPRYHLKAGIPFRDGDA